MLESLWCSNKLPLQACLHQKLQGVQNAPAKQCESGASKQLVTWVSRRRKEGQLPCVTDQQMQALSMQALVAGVHKRVHQKYLLLLKLLLLALLLLPFLLFPLLLLPLLLRLLLLFMLLFCALLLFSQLLLSLQLLVMGFNLPLSLLLL